MKHLLAFCFVIASLPAQAGLTLGAYNIRNFDYDVRARIHTDKPVLAQILNQINADVLSVEEINNTKEFENFIASKLPGHAVALSECGGEHGQHLGFIYKTATVELLNFSEDSRLSGQGGGCNKGSRPLAIGLFKVKATGQKFYGMTAHLKAGGQQSSQQKRKFQYQQIKEIITALRAKSGVQDFYVAGDFNTTEYVSRGNDYTNLTRAVKDLRMVDLTQNLKCSAYWWGGSDDGIEEPSLLDHLIVTPGLITNKFSEAKLGGHCQAVSCKSATAKELGESYQGVSDHCPISATVQ